MAVQLPWRLIAYGICAVCSDFVDVLNIQRWCFVFSVIVYQLKLWRIARGMSKVVHGNVVCFAFAQC